MQQSQTLFIEPSNAIRRIVLSIEKYKICVVGWDASADRQIISAARLSHLKQRCGC